MKVIIKEGCKMELSEEIIEKLKENNIEYTEKEEIANKQID